MLIKTFISCLIIGILVALLSIATDQKWIMLIAKIFLLISAIAGVLLIIIGVDIYFFNGSIPELIHTVKSWY